MNARNYIFPVLLGLLLAACGSSPADEQPDTGASGPDAGTNNGDSDAGDVPAVDLISGLYETPREDPAQGWLIVWEEKDSGRLVVEGEEPRTYDVSFSDDVITLMPVDGVCPSCSPEPLSVRLVRESGVTWRLQASDPDAGLADLRFQPHDGFKPEFYPVDVDLVFEGPVIAATGQATSQPVHDGDCTLSISGGELHDFSCDRDPWSNVEAAADSSPAFAMNDTRIAWILRIDDARIALIGERTSESDRIPGLRGTVRLVDGNVTAESLLTAEPPGERIGYFDLTQLTD